MRKLLLVSAAATIMLTDVTASVFAQTAYPTLPPSPTQGVVSAPLVVQAANNSNNRAVAPDTNGISNPTPGSIVVHLNARVLFGGASEFSSLNNFRATATASAQKLSNFGAVGYVRIFPGVDGMTANGLRYGASAELRQDYGPSAGSTANSGGSANSFSSTLYV
jgi:hypothetical protein